jgi:hypothetical protein
VQPDIWELVAYLQENGYRRFPHIQAVMGRRASKGLLGGILGAEQIAYFFSLDNWQAHYGLIEDKDGYLSVVATSQNQAKRHQFRDIASVVEHCGYLQPHISSSKDYELAVRTRADLRRLSRLKAAGVTPEHEIATLRAIALSTISDVVRGAAGFCLDPETPILTADLRWVPLRSVLPGDEVISVEEMTEPGKQRRMRKARVLGRMMTCKKAYRLIFDDGRSVVCSGDHRWLCRVPGKGRVAKWRTTRGRDEYHSIRPGTEIFDLVAPWESDDSREAGYLAGVYDGEGSLSRKGVAKTGIATFFSQNPGVVLDKTMRLMKEKGFDVKPQNSAAYLTTANKQCQQWAVRGIPNVLRFLGQIRPERLLEKAASAYDGVTLRATPVRTVVSVEELPEQELIDIQTTTGTFVANGLISHNCNMYDEAAHFIQTGSTKSGEEIYESGQPALDQFGKDALTYIPSSPFTKIGFFFRLYQEGRIRMRTGREITTDTVDVAAKIAELSADPEMFIVQLPSWGLYQDWARGPELIGAHFPRPIQWPPTGDRPENERMARLKTKNPDAFRVEREGQFAEVIGAYLDPDKVDAIFVPVSWHQPPELTHTPFGRLDIAYRIHVDPSVVGANFALAIGHTELAPCDKCGALAEHNTHFHPCKICTEGMHWPHVFFDRLHAWRPRDFEPNPETGKREIDYLQVERELDDTLYTFPSTTKFSSDQCQNIGLLQHLRQKYSPAIRVIEETATEKSNFERAERFKSAVNLGWLHCLAGDTRVLTPTGPVPIRELSGRVPRLLTTSAPDGRGGGKWVDAPVFSYGERPLTRITLRRNGVDKVIHATDQHRWFVRRSSGTGHYRDEVLTKDLKPGQRLSYCYAQRHMGTVPSPIGIAHGFTYGDGTRSRKGSVAQFCGDKDKALVPYFDMHRIVDIAPGVRRALDLPRFFKEKVDLDESPSYLYGWLAGYMAADGHVIKNGLGVEIDSADRGSIEHVRTVCNLLGIPTTSIRTKLGYGGGYKDTPSYAVNFKRDALTEDFFLIEEHRVRWMASRDHQIKDYHGYTVVSVEETDQWEEVFCATVPGTGSFVLEDNILTGNCYKDSLYEDNESSLLELECKFLTEKNRKIYKQDFGPVQTKDLYDAVSVVATDLLHEALERWSSGRLTAHAFGSSNVAGLKSGRELERAAAMGSASIYRGGHRGSGGSWEQLDSYQLARRRGKTYDRRYSPDRAQKFR